MSFTDNDLKWLKITLEGDLVFITSANPRDLEILKSLLARLEAAERCIKKDSICCNYCNLCNHVHDIECPLYLWLASKGTE